MPPKALPRVSFELAQRVWDDPLHVVIPDRVEDGEQRWHAIGLVGAVVVLLVVHSYPDADDKQRVRIHRRAQGDGG